MEVKRNVVSQPIDFAEDPWPFVSDCAKDLCQRSDQAEYHIPNSGTLSPH